MSSSQYQSIWEAKVPAEVVEEVTGAGVTPLPHNE